MTSMRFSCPVFFFSRRPKNEAKERGFARRLDNGRYQHRSCRFGRFLSSTSFLSAVLGFVCAGLEHSWERVLCGLPGLHLSGNERSIKRNQGDEKATYGIFLCFGEMRHDSSGAATTTMIFRQTCCTCILYATICIRTG